MHHQEYKKIIQSYFPDHTCGIAYRNTIVRNIINHDRASPDCDIGTDRDTGKYRYTAAYPDIVTYFDRPGSLVTGVPFHRIRTMTRRIYADIRSDETVVPDSHRRLSKNRKRKIREEPSPH